MTPTVGPHPLHHVGPIIVSQVQDLYVHSTQAGHAPTVHVLVFTGCAFLNTRDLGDAGHAPTVHVLVLTRCALLNTRDLGQAGHAPTVHVLVLTGCALLTLVRCWQITA